MSETEQLAMSHCPLNGQHECDRKAFICCLFLHISRRNFVSLIKLRERFIFCILTAIFADKGRAPNCASEMFYGSLQLISAFTIHVVRTSIAKKI